MLRYLARHLALFVCPLLVALGTACAYSTVAAPRADYPEPLLVPSLAGKAYFVDIGNDYNAIRFYVRGSYSRAAGSDVKLLSLRVYGAPGRLGKDEFDDKNFLKEFDGAKLATRVWDLGPQDFDGDQLKFPVDKLGSEKKLKDYSLQLQFRFAYTDPSTHMTTERITSAIGTFTSWSDPSKRLDLQMSSDKKPGDTITKLTGTGTFSGGDRTVLYDIHVEFSGSATRIQAFAGPNPNPTTQVYDYPYAATVSHDANHVVARYNGVADQYYLTVKVTYSDSSDSKAATFTDILANQGGPIEMSMWTWTNQ
jgi:hypothetical protein